MPIYKKIVASDIESYCYFDCTHPREISEDDCVCAKGYDKNDDGECIERELSDGLKALEGVMGAVFAATGPAMVVGADPTMAWALMNLM